MRIGTPKLSPGAREKLGALFARVPRSFLTELAAAVAADRERGGTGLPHDGILSLLHKQIRRADEAHEEERKDIESTLRIAPREILHALPFSSFGGFGARAAPLDLSQPPDLDRLRHAEEQVRVLAGLDRLVATHGLEAQLWAARSEVAAIVRALTEGLSRELKASRFSVSAQAYREPVRRLASEMLAKWELGALGPQAEAA